MSATPKNGWIAKDKIDKIDIPAFKITFCNLHLPSFGARECYAACAAAIGVGLMHNRKAPLDATTFYSWISQHFPTFTQFIHTQW